MRVLLACEESQAVMKKILKHPKIGERLLALAKVVTLRYIILESKANNEKRKNSLPRNDQ